MKQNKFIQSVTGSGPDLTPSVLQRVYFTPFFRLAPIWAHINQECVFVNIHSRDCFVKNRANTRSAAGNEDLLVVFEEFNELDREHKFSLPFIF